MRTTFGYRHPVKRFIDPKTGKLDYWAWLDAGAANLGKGGVFFEDDMPEAMESGAVKPQQLGVVASGSPENKRMPDEETFEEKRTNFGYGSEGLALNVAAKARGQQPGAGAPGDQPGQVQPPVQAGQPGQTQPPAQGGTGQAGTPQTTTPAQPGQAPQTGGGAQPGQSPEANDPRIRPEDMGPTPSYEEWQASPWGKGINWKRNLPSSKAEAQAVDPHAYEYPVVGTPPDTPEGRKIRELIEKYARQHNVPVQLMFNKAYVESGGTWKTNLENSAEAKGLFQFTPETAKEYRINPLVLEENIEGAARMVRKRLDMSNGDPFIAEIGYNANPRHMFGQGPLPFETFYHLQKVFPGQRQNYLWQRMPNAVAANPELFWKALNKMK